MELVQRTVKLSANGLATIPKRRELDDFTFVVGDRRYSYSYPTFVAGFISPKIPHQHDTDLTICEYIVETKVS